MAVQQIIAIAVAAIIPLLIGGFWYSPGVTGRMLDVELGDAKKGERHPSFVFIACYVFSLMISLFLYMVLNNMYGQETTMLAGAGFGAITALLIGIPSFAVIALFEFKSFKYLMIHGLYWLICFAVMGLILGRFI